MPGRMNLVKRNTSFTELLPVAASESVRDLLQKYKLSYNKSRLHKCSPQLVTPECFALQRIKGVTAKAFGIVFYTMLLLGGVTLAHFVNIYIHMKHIEYILDANSPSPLFFSFLS